MSGDHLLFAFMVNDAERLRCLLHRYRQLAWLQASDKVTEWGVGQYMSGRAMLRTQPGPLDVDLFANDLLHSTSDTPLLLARASMSDTLPSFEDTQPFRLGRWLFATEGAIDLAGRRDDLLEELPDFLRRARQGRADAELIFLGFMAELHRKQIRDQHADPEVLVSLLRDLVQRVDTPINIFTTNGHVLLAYRAGPPLFYCQFEGMKRCERCRIGDKEDRFAPLVQSHRRFKGLCVASRPFETPETWHEIPMRDALVETHAFSGLRTGSKGRLPGCRQASARALSALSSGVD